MASLKSIKTKIISYKKTGTVTHAMEAVSAVKMRKSQERALAGRAYAAAALSVLKRLAGTADAERHALAREQLGKTCFVVITSDKGLAGSLNSAVIRRVEDEIRSRALPKNDIVIIAVGRRGGDYFTSRGYDVRVKHENVGDGVSESDIRMVTDNILAWHAAGEIGACVIAYQNFLSTFEQEAGVRQIVPITQEMITDMVKHIRPVKGKYAPAAAEEDKGPDVYTIEPDADEVLSVLLPKLLNTAIFHAFLEAKASEHSARMVAMKNATDKAKEMASDLTRTFNKVRQAVITREVSEITSGIEAMK
ncbi:ATP synthase F1 subunit gamma [Candidatus Kaiserbacteria bacterium RIFCSPLOWO2_01_FULL_54_24]|uniref:ATP synthase gamma chain n=1 Tax=Candidatus Kaiserbacteria bacterium RIFCSPLOWO2_01_FULL_54_24 TaxID=1798515 RepID=A0A1F6ESW7_9BACT|nr:MAG: ATP synthase F1 subunit gamma [Candidatus Kaiserbacteria bacterium RIFCSPLOWO2_01_FULL_54_24]